MIKKNWTFSVLVILVLHFNLLYLLFAKAALLSIYVLFSCGFILINIYYFVIIFISVMNISTTVPSEIKYWQWQK